MTPVEEPPIPPVEQPAPWVWLVIAALVIFLCAAALMSIISPPGVEGDQLKIHRILSAGEVDYGPNPISPNKDAVPETIQKLEALQTEDPAANGTKARALAVLRYLADRSAHPNFTGFTDAHGKSRDALTRAANSKEDIAKANAAIKSLIGDKNLADEQKAEIDKTLIELGARWPIDAAMRELPDAKQTPTTEDAIAGFAFLGVLLLGTGCLVWVFASKGINQLPISGTSATGDGLGLRFLLFMVVFIFVGGTIPDFFQDHDLGAVITTATLAVLQLAIVGLYIKGRTFAGKQIGLRTENLGKDILYGIAGFLANIPVLIILIITGMYLLRWIPSGGHPVQYEFLSSNLFLLILAIGPLTGFVEELAFRGFLFQGLALRFGIMPGMLLSSFAFAMIHPQGGALWLVLAWIGGMGAYLTYKRSSLIPAIIMHALHNSVMLILVSIALR